MGQSPGNEGCSFKDRFYLAMNIAEKVVGQYVKLVVEMCRKL